MKTKLDRQREQMAERAKRAENIASLNRQIDEARNILAVIPTNAGLESEQERRVVMTQINALTELLEDEKIAYNEALADEQTANAIVEKMGL